MPTSVLVNLRADVSVSPCYIKDTSGEWNEGAEPLLIKICIVAISAQAKRRGVDRGVHGSATQKRPCSTYFAWGAASQSAPLLVTFGVKSDRQRLWRLICNIKKG